MIGQPVKTMPQFGVFDRGTLNDVPGWAHDGPQMQYGRQLLFVGGHGQVLLIGQNEEGFSCQMFVGHQRMQFFPHQLKTVNIVGVYHKCNAVGLFKIVWPQLPKFALSPNVPHFDVDIANGHLFQVETQCGHGVLHRFFQFQSVQHCGFASIVQSQNQDARVPFEGTPQFLELRKNYSHCVGCLWMEVYRVK